MALNQSIVADDYFNDLSRQPHSDHSPQESPSEPSQNATNKEPSGASKLKRIACVVCRKRKLKCDGCKPSCATCSRLGHLCAYDEVRRKSGPKRGYVKELEARLGATLQYDNASSAWKLTLLSSLKPKSKPSSRQKCKRSRHQIRQG